MTEAEGEKWGLVPTHAYAVLDIREFKVPPHVSFPLLFLFASKTSQAFQITYELFKY